MKRMIRTILMAVLIVSAATLTGFADERSSVNTFVGARPQGLGGAFVAVADDATGMRYNPGGMGYLWLREANLMFSQNFAGINGDHVNQFYLGLVNPIPGYFNVGLNGIFLSTTDYSDINVGLDFSKAFDINSDIQLSPGLGVNLLRNSFSLNGVPDSVIQQDPTLKAASQPLTTFGIDFGVLVRYQKVWGFGISAENLNGPKASNTTDDKLPIIGRVGASYIFQDWLLGAVGIKTTIGQQSSDFDYNVGAEAWFVDHSLGLRVGNNKNELTLGGSYVATALWGLQFDYSLAYPTNSLSGPVITTHRIGVTYRREIPPPQYPDLMVENRDLSLSTKDIIQGQKIGISAWIHNIGNEEAQKVKVSFWNETPQGRCELLHPIDVIDLLNMKDSTLLTFDWTAPEPGDYRFDINVDDDGTMLPKIFGSIEELNEGNNHAYVTAHVFKAPTAEIAAAPDKLIMTHYTDIREDRPMLPLIFFEEGSDQIDPRFLTMLGIVAQRVQLNPSVKLELYGYYGEKLDAPLTPEQGKPLALRRAENVKKALLKDFPEIEKQIIIKQDHDMSATRSGKLEEIVNTKDVPLFSQENRRVEMRCVTATARDLAFDTEDGVFNLTSEQVATFRKDLSENPDLIVLLYGRSGLKEADPEDKAFDRVVRAVHGLVKQLGQEFENRTFILVHEPATAEKAGVDIKMTPDGLLYRPAMVTQSEAIAHPSTQDSTFITLKSDVEAGAKDWSFTLLDKNHQTLQTVASGHGTPPKQVVWNFKGTNGKYIDENKPVTSKFTMTDRLGQEITAESNPMHVEIAEVEGDIQRMVSVQFAFNKDMAVSPALESRIEYIARKVTKTLRELQPKQSFSILIEGHSDNTGLFYRNEELSIRRAEKELALLRRYMRYLLDLPDDNALTQYLKDHRTTLKSAGLADKKPFELTTKDKNGVIKTELIGDNRFPEGRSINRRIMAETQVKTTN